MLSLKKVYSLIASIITLCLGLSSESFIGIYDSYSGGGDKAYKLGLFVGRYS